MFTGGVNATCYDIEPNIILCTLMRGWFAPQMKEFMLRQPGVVEVEWNQVKYKPTDVKEDAIEVDEADAPGKKGKGQGKRGKRGKREPGVKLPKPKKRSGGAQRKTPWSGVGRRGKGPEGGAVKDEL